MRVVRHVLGVRGLPGLVLAVRVVFLPRGEPPVDSVTEPRARLLGAPLHRLLGLAAYLSMTSGTSSPRRVDAQRTFGRVAHDVRPHPPTTFPLGFPQGRFRIARASLVPAPAPRGPTPSGSVRRSPGPPPWSLTRKRDLRIWARRHSCTIVHPRPGPSHRPSHKPT